MKVVGYDEVAEGECFVQILDSLGRGTASYYWYDLPDDGLYGWLDGADEPVTQGQITFAPGEAYWVKAPSASYSIQSAGQVPNADIEVILRNGFKMIANPSPVNVDLNEITVTGYDEVAEGECFVQILDSLGRGTASYYWYDLPDDGLYGWLDGADEPVEAGALSFTPGEGVWVKAPNTNYNLVFPGVNL